MNEEGSISVGSANDTHNSLSPKRMEATIAYLVQRLEKYEPDISGFKDSEAFRRFVQQDPGYRHIVEGNTHIVAYPNEHPQCKFCNYSANIQEKGKDKHRIYDIRISGVDAAEVTKVISKVQKDIQRVDVEKKGLVGKFIGFVFQEGIVPTLVRIIAGIVVAYLIFRLGYR